VERDRRTSERRRDRKRAICRACSRFNGNTGWSNGMSLAIRANRTHYFRVTALAGKVGLMPPMPRDGGRCTQRGRLRCTTWHRALMITDVLRLMGDGQVPVGLSAVIHGLQRKKDTKTEVCTSGKGSRVRVGDRCQFEMGVSRRAHGGSVWTAISAGQEARPAPCERKAISPGFAICSDGMPGSSRTNLVRFEK
jgi:hypothetical protein